VLATGSVYLVGELLAERARAEAPQRDAGEARISLG
jgi:hypothetical protein